MKFIKQSLPLFILLLAAACKEQERKSPARKILPDSAIVSTQQAIPSETYPSVDISPMDMSYFPVDYPKLKMAAITKDSQIGPPVVRVIYSRPHLQNRHLFRDLLKYNEPWRLGANESTEIDFYKSVKIQGKKILPGRYIVYAIPQQDKWTIVLNTNIDSWGLHSDPRKDIQRFDVPVTTGNPVKEYFTMIFEKADKGANLVMSWADLMAKLPIEI